ncbi:hypothetical protein GIB67_036771 [Kingdonia uniflora]|uniref:Uncharacterized protein n=1 Tax=Kingdonia uniflora TaxID=39325 RepID=A0A7J7LWV8_9MAGN|nr:hypothetical protein GIB67_036771 [Kingdonia uniflora]
MDVKLSRPTSNTKKREAEQDEGLAKVNKHHPSYKRKKNMNERIEADKEPQIEQFRDVDFNDKSAPQRNDLGVDLLKRLWEPNQLKKPGCLCVHHHAPTWHLEKEPTIVRDLVMLAARDKHIPFQLGEMTLSLDDVQHLIGLSADGDVPITEGSWSLSKLVKIFKKNLYQDEDFFNSMKTGGQGNSLSLVKLVNFNVGKLEKYNNSIQNERPVGQKKKDKANIKWFWGSVVFAHLFHNLGTASRTDGKQIAAYMTLLETKECQVLNVENTKLVEDMRIKIGVDASNASLNVRAAFEQLAVIPKGEAVPSRDLQKKIDELTVKYEDVVKRWVAKCKSDTAIHDKKIKTLHSQLIVVEEMKNKLEVEHYEWKVWRQAMKKEFHTGELVEKDDPTFIELFDQYDRFYIIAQQGPKGDYQEDFTYHLDVRDVQGEDYNSAFRVPGTIKHQSQNQFKKVMNLLESLLTKDPAFWKTIFSQSLDTHFSSRGEIVYEQLRLACLYGGQHVEYRHMGYLLVTCYEKVVVFISNHEAYTFLPLFWLRKNNHISNKKRFENLVGDTTKFWWVGLGSDNQYVRLFTRYGAPMPPVSTLWLAHVDLGHRGDFQRDMVHKWFGVTNKLFKVLPKENNVKGYKLNDLI